MDCCPSKGSGSDGVYSSFIVAPIACVFSVRSLFCYAVLCVIPSFTMIHLGKSVLVHILLFLISRGCCCSLHIPHGCMG